MALATIEVLAGYDPARKRILVKGVHHALVTALEVPDDDPAVRIVEHTPDSWHRYLTREASSAFTGSAALEMSGL